MVQRRFKEFVALHHLLLIRFPYRLIPELPSKKFYGNGLSDSVLTIDAISVLSIIQFEGDIHFVEERRKALERFLNLVARHPTLSADSLVHSFLTAKNDVIFESSVESTEI